MNQYPQPLLINVHLLPTGGMTKEHGDFLEGKIHIEKHNMSQRQMRALDAYKHEQEKEVAGLQEEEVADPDQDLRDPEALRALDILDMVSPKPSRLGAALTSAAFTAATTFLDLVLLLLPFLLLRT